MIKITITDRNKIFGMVIDHKEKWGKFCMKYFLWILNYKHHFRLNHSGSGNLK
jgi:hypothetical protein